MIVDSHLHVNFRKLGVRELISYMDREGIDMCWLLTWEEMSPQTTNYVSLPVEDVFDAYSRYPSRIIPMYAPDPAGPDAVKRFMEWRKTGIGGCGELKVSLGWDSPKLDPLLSCLNKLGLPLIMHMEQGAHLFRPTTTSRLDALLARFLNSTRFNGLPRKVIDAAARRYSPLEERKDRMHNFFPGYLADFAALEGRLKEFPDIKFIGHGPMFWSGFTPKTGKGASTREGITCRLLAEYDNLYADLSARGYMAIVRDPDFSKSFLSEHSHKILYGTDNFFLGLRPFLDSLRLSKKSYKRIYGENAMGLTGLGATSQAARLAS